MIWLQILAVATVCGAIIIDATKGGYEKTKRKLCESCIYLKTKSKGTYWKYYCDMHDGFDRCPEYCRDYREREPKEE